jgi:metallo-beta-lactamase family protein
VALAAFWERYYPFAQSLTDHHPGFLIFPGGLIMKIHFNGAARTVTGSQFLLEVNGQKLLIDCGLYQGKREESYRRNRSFRFNPARLDAVILSHAHIDHSGTLPLLVKQGYQGKIFGTPATCDLADIMLRDSGHIQESDAEYVNKKRSRRGEPPVEPLYTQADAEHVSEHLVDMNYEQEFEPIDGVKVRLHDAGHILGSSSVELIIRENGQTRRVWFSGDIGRKNLHILRDPVFPENAEYLIMESTYGDKTRGDPSEAYEELYEVVMAAIKRRGKIIVPAFAVGRTQELVYALNQFISAGRMPPIPVYVDSPLAVNVSDVFRRHKDCYDAETNAFISLHKHPALEFDGLTYVRSVQESISLNSRPGPMIIIAASGMAENGRILHHLKNNIEDDRNTVLIVSWQAPDTLGRRLAERATEVRIFGEVYRRRARVVTIGGLSAHAGQNTLVDYAAHTRWSLKGVYLVHGELPAANALAECLRARGIQPVCTPEPGQVEDL